jgi:hypothetical protein
MTSITFNNDKDRENFIISMALTGLRNEVKYNHIVCHPSKGTTVKTLARYFTGLKKTRKAAYKQLVDAGIYNLLDKKKRRLLNTDLYQAADGSLMRPEKFLSINKGRTLSSFAAPGLENY